MWELAILASQRACMRVVVHRLAAVLLEFPVALQTAHSLAGECRSGLQAARRCCLFNALRPRARAGRGFDSRAISTQQIKTTPRGCRFCLLVEAGGIEPPSASPLQAVLHT